MPWISLLGLLSLASSHMLQVHSVCNCSTMVQRLEAHCSHGWSSYMVPSPCLCRGEPHQ